MWYTDRYTDLVGKSVFCRITQRGIPCLHGTHFHLLPRRNTVNTVSNGKKDKVGDLSLPGKLLFS